MDVRDLPWERRIAGGFIVFGVLLGLGYARRAIDWGFILTVSVLYVVVMLALDVARHRLRSE